MGELLRSGKRPCARSPGPAVAAWAGIAEAVDTLQDLHELITFGKLQSTSPHPPALELGAFAARWVQGH